MALRSSQLWLVCQFEVARRLRSVSGIVAMVFLVVASAAVGHQLAEAARALREVSSGQNADAFRMLTEMVASMAEFPLDTVQASLDAHSPPLVGAFAFLMFIGPLVAFSMGYDQCASDIETRHARYLAFRVDRTSLYLGKLLGAWTLVAATISVATVSMAAYIAVRSGRVPTLDDAVYVARIIATVSGTSLPLLGLLGLLGTLRGRSRRVALFAVLAWVLIGLCAAFVRESLELETVATGIEALWPTNGRWSLLFDAWTPWAASFARVAVYTAVVTTIGVLHFRKRDL